MPPEDLLKFQAERDQQQEKEQKEFKEARAKSRSPVVRSPRMRNSFLTQETQTEWSWLKDMEVSDRDAVTT